MPFQILAVSDGTIRVSLLNTKSGFYCTDWSPSVTEPKGRGVWQDSSLTDGRHLAMRKRANVNETFRLQTRNFSPDDLIRDTQELRRLLEKAVTYWTSEWQSEPVWIEAQGQNETNLRYSIIEDYRTPRDGYPYEDDFWNGVAAAAFSDWPLVLEREPWWRADQPGTGTCVEASGTQDAYPFFLEFDGDTSEVDCGSNALLDDLPSSTMTAEAWIRADGWGEGGVGRIFDKLNWFFRVESGLGLYAWFFGNITNGSARSAPSTFEPDGQWHHVAITWTYAAGTGDVRIWLDGTEVTNSAVQLTGGYVSDAAANLYIGNVALGTACFDGGIGWCRLSNNIRYAAGFTPPPRCALPDPTDANTIAQWIGVENSGATIDNQEGTAVLDGTQTNCTFDVGCTSGRAATCLDEVYVANKHNRAQLTHIYHWDQSLNVWSGNLFGAATPFAFLPAVPAINDIVCFGIDTTHDDSGPFCSLVFDIETAQVDLTSIIWQYWNGAWVTLTVQDNTNAGGAMTGDAFDTTGVNSIHWEQPSDWATNAVNTVTGYWVRARVAGIGGAPAPPTQQNRDIYTITWPYIEVDEAQISGDIEALARDIITNVSYRTLGSLDLYVERAIIGLRSLSRGSDFTAYINLADEQNPANITINTGVSTSFTNYVQSPTGRVMLYNPPGIQAFGIRADVQLSPPLVNAYYGIHHLFMRVIQSGGAADDFTVRTRLNFGGVTTVGQAVVDGTNAMEVLDFGQIRIPFGSVLFSEDINDGHILIDVSNSNAAPGDLYLIDLILMPVDEWALDTEETDVTYVVAQPRYLDVDSVMKPKTPLRSIAKYSDDDILGFWQAISPSPAILQANSDQRLWFFIHKIASAIYYAPFEICNKIQAFTNERYLASRGDR